MNRIDNMLVKARRAREAVRAVNSLAKAQNVRWQAELVNCNVLDQPAVRSHGFQLWLNYRALSSLDEGAFETLLLQEATRLLLSMELKHHKYEMTTYKFKRTDWSAYKNPSSARWVNTRLQIKRIIDQSNVQPSSGD